MKAFGFVVLLFGIGEQVVRRHFDQVAASGLGCTDESVDLVLEVGEEFAGGRKGKGAWPGATWQLRPRPGRRKVPKEEEGEEYKLETQMQLNLLY